MRRREFLRQSAGAAVAVGIRSSLHSAPIQSGALSGTHPLPGTSALTEQGDFAMLMIESARALGFAARFASGYLAVPSDEPEEPASGSTGGSTHAWAQIYLPGTGWIDFDPTRGSAGTIGLVTVAVVRDPRHATPLHGTYIGFPSDHLTMEVQVRVTSDAPAAANAISERPTRRQFGRPV